jgi:hypothetical protein
LSPDTFVRTCVILVGMARETKNDRLLNRIIIYGFSVAFGMVLASLEALRPTTSGFAIEISRWTLVTLVVGAAGMFPWFYFIIYSQRRYLRRVALTVVTLLGLGAFFYPMRVVPEEKMRPIFIGLAAAAAALSIMGGFLLLLHHFFESEEKRIEH